MAFPVKQDDLVKGVVMAGVSLRSDGISALALVRDVAVAADGDILITSLPSDAEGRLNSLVQRPPTKATSMSDVMTLPGEVTPVHGGDSVETLATVVAFRPTADGQFKRRSSFRSRRCLASTRTFAGYC